MAEGLPRKFVEYYHRPGRGECASIRYSFDRASRYHTIRLLTPTDGDLPPSLRRFSSVTLATEELDRLRDILAENGYIPGA